MCAVARRPTVFGFNPVKAGLCFDYSEIALLKYIGGHI